MGDTTIRVSDELADELYDRKQRGESYEEVIWRLIENRDEAGSQESPDGPQSLPDRRDALSPPAEHEVAEADEEEPEGAEELLRSLDLSGSGSRYDARVNAVLEFYAYLQDHPGERVSRGDLEELVDERDIDIGYGSFKSLWGNWIKKNTSQGRDFDTLARLPGVQIDGRDYIYTKEEV
ncbi:hypothetical protein CP556_25120 [Natrinema sp. CBA1119]|uniref:hypothetical protein n=1 Tax=Natrinema sp. CBA1119 TaxID=1608465 RepID=UPI000BF90236|nr:hypothetical protein [Natrinema sp. CBA1119]PGF13812.1 hypothetical protein CP556_25120 [Natrinema sp. CBA1119]